MAVADMERMLMKCMMLFLFLPDLFFSIGLAALFE
jgi:hypothetical protein